MTLYSVDTSALILGINEYYRPENFPRLWDHVDALIDDGRFRASDFVADEVKAKADDVHAWLEPRYEAFIVESDSDVMVRARAILKSHPKLTKETQTRTRADPFVIALAQQRGGVVVTGEGFGSVERPRIPNVCDALGIECISLPEVVAREGWTF